MRRPLPRRTFLRGAGTVAIALPFLEEMRLPRAQAAGEDVPNRLVTLAFGLGIPTEHAELGFAGPLEPLQPFASKLACFSGLDMSQAHQYGTGTTHFKTGDVLFVGEPQKNEYTAAGPSLEQLMLRELHPAAAHVRVIGTDHAHIGVDVDQRAGFVGAVAADVHLAGQDQRARLFPRLDEPFLHQQGVQPHAPGHMPVGPRLSVAGHVRRSTTQRAMPPRRVDASPTWSRRSRCPS